jgi:alpha-D-ribose 1-methylphosphonate 5-triphosphate diphosphatase
MRSLRITGGQMLLPSSRVQDGDVLLANGFIQTLGGGTGDTNFDATGLLVLPGIVDIHGDAFERQMQPRPGVDFPADLALRDTEAQLLANGITTAFHGVTLSWEPGLRSLDAWSRLLNALEAGTWIADMRVHLRWEAFNLDALDTAVADIAAGRVHLLAFNDHTPAILQKLGDPVAGAKYSDRAGMKMDAFKAMAERIGAAADSVPAGLERIGAAARAAGLPMASHDDYSLERRQYFRSQGARICEFPIAEEVGRDARGADEYVVMGSPNVVRGRSHLGWASAATSAEAGICNVLSSDYFYPAMARAATILAGRGVLDLTRSWALVSANPAAATGLTDRGSIEVGKRADIVVLDPATSRPVMTVAGGRIAYIAAEGAARL